MKPRPLLIILATTFFLGLAIYFVSTLFPSTTDTFPPIPQDAKIFSDPQYTDTSLRRSAGKYAFYNNKNLTGHVYFSANPTVQNSIKFVNRQAIISFFTNSNQSFGKAQSTSPNASNNVVTYPNIFPNTDLRYTNSPSQLLEEFIVKDSTTASKMTQIVQTASLTNIDKFDMVNDGINFYQQDKLAARVPQPVMYELNNRHQESFGISYSVTKNSPTELSISKNITAQGLAWLQDPARQYPIVIDLVIDNADTAANWVSSNSSYLVVSQETTIKTEGTGSVKLVGNYAAFGSGVDGACTVSSNLNLNTGSCVGRTAADAINFSTIVNTAVGSSSMILQTGATGISIGDQVIIINLMGSGSTAAVGKYEIVTVSGVGSSKLTFGSTLANAYDGTTNSIMVQRIPQYTTVTINSGITLTPATWINPRGGVLAFKATGTVTNNGVISSKGTGYEGGYAGTVSTDGGQGTSRPGPGGSNTIANDAGGGGGGIPDNAGGGGGGGFGTTGASTNNATGGKSIGVADLSLLFFGSGGGGGGYSSINSVPCAPGNGNPGATGGGIILISGRTVLNNGIITASGNDNTSPGAVSAGRGGGGAGGSVYIQGVGVTVGTTTSSGGVGTNGLSCTGEAGGTGGVGRVRVEADVITGSSTPTASTSIAPNNLNESATLTKASTDLSTSKAITFWVYSSGTGQFVNFQFGEALPTENSFPFTINTANTWEKKTIGITSVATTSRDALTKFAFNLLKSNTVYFDDIQTNDPPNAPTQIVPVNIATTQSHTPTLKIVATDAASDNIQYKINLCTNFALTVGCTIFDQTVSNIGWSGQNVGTSAYSSGTTGVYIIPTGSSLAYDTTYYWNAAAIDPNGSNLWSSYSSTWSFTTDTTPKSPISCLLDQSLFPTSYRFFWQNLATDNNGNEVWRSVNGGGTSMVSTVGAGATGYVDTNISSGNTYRYQVRSTKSTVDSITLNSPYCATTTLSPGIGDLNMSGLNFQGVNFR